MTREEGRSRELAWGPLVDLDTILRFQNSQTLLKLPCLSCHPCVMKVVVPCLETTYFAMRFVLLKLFFPCSSFLQSAFFSQNSFWGCKHLDTTERLTLFTFFLIDTFAFFCFMIKCSYISSFLDRLHCLSDVSINVPALEIFSLSLLSSDSNKDSTLFIFFIAVTIA